ncbi:MAG: primosomal protein N' [Legionella sp.]|nr:primosomal protein N' [Legionella sp.]
MTLVYKICIPHTFKDSYDYLAQDIKPCIGARVRVPFRKQTRLGVVIAMGLVEKEDLKLKDILEVIDQTALINLDIIKLCQWISSYYQSPLSEVIPLALPKKFRQGHLCEVPKMDFYQLTLSLDEANQIIPVRACKQRALIEFLSLQDHPVSKKILSAQGFNSSQLLALLHAKVLRLTQQSMFHDNLARPLSAALMLNPEQAQAVSTICKSLNTYHCFLLQGVTGSGKTEVYLQVIDQVLAQGKQVLILVPEIGLTPQLLSRFTERFGHAIAVIHSNLNETERFINWQLAQDGIIKLIIGTRSSVFTPLPQLGLIVIDEEHDASLKQMDGVRYSARDTALMRAYLADIPIILGSATPSLESLYNHQKNKYTLLPLRHKALSTTPLHYQLIDLRAQVLKHGLSDITVKIIGEHLQQDNQVLVFINRRGFAPILLCHACGWMADCRACDSHLTLHKQVGQMICHHCGLTQKPPGICPKCSNKEFIPVGAGTQRIHEYLSQLFPHTSVIRVDSDETRKKNALHEQLEKINQGKAKLIVGTQMLAKGHHFPRLTLVVVVDADSGIYNQDFKALEQLGQLLTQVAGRAGRAQHPGQVLIQTHLPNHPLLNLLIQKGYDCFAEELLAIRKQALLPPFYFLALIRAQAKSIPNLLKFFQVTKEQMQLHPVEVSGPAPAPLARKANQHRMQLLVKSSSRKALGLALTQMRASITPNKASQSVRWSVDVDPMDLS